MSSLYWKCERKEYLDSCSSTFFMNLSSDILCRLNDASQLVTSFQCEFSCVSVRVQLVYGRSHCAYVPCYREIYEEGQLRAEPLDICQDFVLCKLPHIVVP